MIRMKSAKSIFCALMTASLAQFGNPVYAAPAESTTAPAATRVSIASPPESRGELLYSVSCESCHAKEVHWRAKKLATNAISLHHEIQRWKANVGAEWSEEDVSEVARYLNATFYRFPGTDVPQNPTGPEEQLSPRRQGDIRYISGGLLPEERETLRSATRDYNLLIDFAHKPSVKSFTGARIVLSNATQKNLLDVIASGPLFLAALPTGRYRLMIEKDDSKIVRTLIITKGRAVSLNF